MDLGPTYSGPIIGATRPGMATLDGNDTLNNSGTITGGINLGEGNDILNLTAGSIQNIEMWDDNDAAYWSGGSLTSFDGGDGADTLIVSGSANYNNAQSVSGGTGTDIDTITFENTQATITASNTSNWEVMKSRSGANVEFTASALAFSINTVDTGLIAENGGTFTTPDNFSLTGNLTTEAGGTYKIAPGNITANNSITGTVRNSGKIDLANDTTNSTLTINGDYVGGNGLVVLRTLLGADNSPSNKLIISGNASGTTNLEIQNLGGSGDQTGAGVLIVETGSSATNAFALPNGYVSAGAYDYSLLSRSENNQDNWYLTSTYIPPSPQTGGGGGGGGTVPSLPPVYTPAYSPNLGSMIANQRAANTLFRMRLEDRESAAGYQQNPQRHDPWVRYYSVKNEFDSVSGQLHTYGHNNAMQAGITLLSLGEASRLNAGLMIGYADYNSRSQNKLTQRKSTSGVHGYSVGAYATWYATPEQNHGTYVDTWAQWNHFSNNTSAADGDKYKYTSSGTLASVEVGTDLDIGTLAGHSTWLQPQAQLVYHGVIPDHFRDKQGVRIDPGHTNYEARLGVKAYLDIQDDTGIDYRPYLALNWIHNTDPYHVEVDDKDYKVRGMDNIGEVKLGLEGKLNANNQVWVNTFYAKGGSAQKEYGIDIGWQYSF